MDEFKTMKALADYCGVSPEELWAVAVGGITRNYDFAIKLSEVCGISPQILMFQETQNVRQGFLVWLERLTKIKKQAIWHILSGRRLANHDKAVRMEKATGIARDEWKNGTAWMIRVPRQQGAIDAREKTTAGLQCNGRRTREHVKAV